MKTLIVLFTYIISFFTWGYKPLDPIWLRWDSPEGQARLESSDAKQSFWPLVRYYESQINTSYCGIATAVIALNALGLEPPPSKILGNYRLFTQEEFFSDEISQIIDKDTVEENGLSLETLSEILRTFPIHVSLHKAIKLSYEEIRSTLIASLKNPNQITIILYQRREVAQIGGGHWSPIAAYHEESDSFLVLDVARFKYPPVWIDASTLIRAMQTSNIRGESRGFLILENP